MEAGPNRSIRKRVTLADVAELARVSPSAVSRAFSKNGSVSAKTRAKISRAVEELGFKPNMLASSLATGRSALVALAASSLRDPQMMTIIDAFTIELQNRELRPLIFNLSQIRDWASVISMMEQYQIDGLVIASSALDAEFLDRVAGTGIPTVIAFGRTTGDIEISTARVDNVDGGRKAARAFLSRGYDKFGFIGAREDSTSTKDRLAGFRDELSVRDFAPITLFTDAYSHAEGFQATQRLFSEDAGINAIFCADDLLGMGALDALRFQLRRNVPDVGVIGFSDMEMSRWPSYALSTLRPYTKQVVLTAIDMVQELIEKGHQPPQKRIVSCDFVPRESIRSVL